MLRSFDSKLTFDGLPAAEHDRRRASVIVPSAEGATVYSGLTPEQWKAQTDKLFGEPDQPNGPLAQQDE